MNPQAIALIVVGVLIVAMWVVWAAAQRLDRLHRKVVASHGVVDAQLRRRASVASALASTGLLDPVSSMLVAEASWAALAAADVPAIDEPDALAAPMPLSLDDDAVDRGLAESELTSTLAEALDDPATVAELRQDPVGVELLTALAESWYRVQLARRFHNEAVAQTQRLRRGRVVRWVHLAGRAPMPLTLELDDEWPPALGSPGQPTDA